MTCPRISATPVESPTGSARFKVRRQIFRLYSTVKRRRVAIAMTSIAGPFRAVSKVLIRLRSLLATMNRRQAACRVGIQG